MGFRLRAAIISAVALASVVVPLGHLRADEAATVPNPVVEGPITAGLHGRPWFSSLVNLADHGYVEEEFLFSGSSEGTAYKTRMVVRRPLDHKDFSGTVFVEWVNVTGGRDLETLWPAGSSTLIEEGHAYVVVSAQRVGVTELRAWDPVRYGTLNHPGDNPHSFRIFEQAVQAIRSPGNVDPMGGLDAKRVVASGDSQSAGRLTSYITGGYAIAGHIDGFLPGRGGGNAATGEVMENLKVPALWILEESQGERPADTQWQKFWYQAGASHAPMDWNHYVWRSDMRDLGQDAPVPDAINAGCSVNRGEGHAVRAGIHWIDNWVRDGERPPTGPRLVRDADGELVRDADGHAQGGIRYPYIDVPVALNTAEGCPLFGSYEPWSSADIVARYPTKADYVAKVEAAAAQDVEDGFLLRSDAARVVTAARAFNVWSSNSGTCYDINNPVERAHYDSRIRPCPPAAP